MIMTRSTTNAIGTARRALRGSKPILHIVTDDFGQMMAIMDGAFFEVSSFEKKGAEFRYISLPVMMQEGKNDKSGAREKWINTLHKENVVIYMYADKDGKLSEAALAYLMDYQEQYSMSLYSDGKSVGSRMVLYGRELTIPAALEPMVARIELPELDGEDFFNILKSWYKPDRDELKSQDYMDELKNTARWYADQLAGFPENEIISVLGEIFYGEDKAEGLAHLRDRQFAEKIIRREKRKHLSAHGKLDCVEVKKRKVAALEPVRQWLEEHKANITRSSFENEEDITKGILLLGLPGTGKSMLAETCANILKLPLIRLDISRLLGRYVGDSEKNMDQVLQDLTVAGAPCVLWIDELDKAYSGVGKGNGGGSAVVDRLFGKMLTFMQEMHRSVFMVATANDISEIPPEMFRAGRFGQIFSLMLPSYKECVEILCIKLEHHLGSNNLDGETVRNLMDICCGLKKWNDVTLADCSDQDSVRFLTGADISQMAHELCIELGLKPGCGDMGSKSKNEIYCAMQKAASRCRATVNTGIPLTLERAAICYHKVLEQGAVSANAGNPICVENYQPGNVKAQPDRRKEPQCLKRTKKLSPYDEALFRQIGCALDEQIYKWMNRFTNK